MKRFTIVLAGAALMLGTSVSAGEIAGNGKPVGAPSVAASECSYSGLNDTPDDEMGFTQTFASFWKALIGMVIPSAPWHPGTSCNGR